MRFHRVLTSCALILIAGYLLNFSLALQDLTRNGNAVVAAGNEERPAGREIISRAPATRKPDFSNATSPGIPPADETTPWLAIIISIALIGAIVGIKVLREANAQRES